MDNTYVEFGCHAYQQTVGIPMGTNCTRLMADLFLYSNEADFVQHLQGSILVSKLLSQGYSSRKHQTTFRKFYCRHTDRPCTHFRVT